MRRPWRPKTCQRIWVERRPNLGRETNESGTRDDRIWDEKRTNLGRETDVQRAAFDKKYSLRLFA